MKLFVKLSALGVVVLLVTAFASADTIQIVSNNGVVYTGYNPDPTNSTPTSTTSVNTWDLNNVTPTWTHEGPNSNWVSWDPNSAPGGGETAGSCLPPGPCSAFDADGTYTYVFTFTTTGAGFYDGIIGVMADDTTNVILNGTDELLPEGTVIGAFELDSALAGFNSDGVNTLTFVVQQTGSSYQGLDFWGSITSTTPEPNTLILLGTGLLGSAGALFRKMRASA